jgi:NifU-like protein involved in Fe-S cluster formation
MNPPAVAPEYSPEVRQRFERAPCHGGLSPGSSGRLAGAAGEVRHGARVEFEARTRDGRVIECRFRAYGCPHVIAAASWVAEHAQGRAVNDLDWLQPRHLATLLEAPTHKLGGLLVVEDAYRACVGAQSKA